jgi:hypothetical protein
MEHPTEEELCDLVIDPLGNEQARAHVQSCEQCRTEVEAIRDAAELLSGGAEVELLTPPTGLWTSIVDELDTGSTRKPWILSVSRLVQVAAVGLLIGMLGGWLVWGQQPPHVPEERQSTVLASTALQDQATKGNRGQAQLIQRDGETVLSVQLRDAARDDVLSVWLSNPTSGERVQVGLVDPARDTSTFSIPAHLVDGGFKDISVSQAGRKPAPRKQVASGAFATSPSPTRSPVPTTSAAPTPRPTTTPRPSLTPKRACRHLMASPKYDQANPREKRIACRTKLREWRANHATPSPQPRTIQPEQLQSDQPDQLQPEVLPQPSQT